MSGPRHLWSGDWERESAESERSHPEPPPVTETSEEQEELSEATSDRGRRNRMLAIVTGATIVLVVVAVVLADTLGGSDHHRPKPVASVPHRATTTPPGNNGGSTLPQQTTPQTQTSPGTPSTPQTQTSPGTPTTPGPNGFPQTTVPTGPSTVTNKPHVNWLGMQIITSPNGAVVNTIRSGSTADITGFEPGDVIINVAGTAISAAKDIRAATGSVKVGALVPVEITRGSTLIRIAVRMQGRPTVSP
jgi:membrane-associated protease RseP (regulator of RpoE activity)